MVCGGRSQNRRLCTPERARLDSRVQPQISKDADGYGARGALNRRTGCLAATAARSGAAYSPKLTMAIDLRPDRQAARHVFCKIASTSGNFFVSHDKGRCVEPRETIRFQPLTVDWQAALAQHGRWLRTVVRARLQEWQGVDEVLQEVSQAAVAQRAPLADPAKVAPWLYRLAVRHVLLYRRKMGRQRKLVDRFARETRPTEFDRRHIDPLEWLLADERGRLVRTALARLAARDAEMLMLKYSENWSYHEIAAHLGISHSAVETRLHRARQRLRDELTEMKMIEV